MESAKATASQLWDAAGIDGATVSPDQLAALLASADDPFPPTPPQDGRSEAEKLHVIAKLKPTDGTPANERPLDDTTLQVLVFGVSGGRTDTLTDLTDEEIRSLKPRVLKARRGNLGDDYGPIAEKWAAWADNRQEVLA